MVKFLPGPAPGGRNSAMFFANLGPIESWTYFRVNGPGTVRIAASRDELETSMAGTLQDDGLPQVVADGEVARMWAGELWAISSAPTALIVICPKFSSPMNRAMQASAR